MLVKWRKEALDPFTRREKLKEMGKMMLHSEKAIQECDSFMAEVDIKLEELKEEIIGGEKKKGAL